jgi:NAD(P)-dependent dehydrogenase (short-subunit alcohol dehydrogenase family)
MDSHSAIITGAAQNIGAGIAKTLSAVDATVMIDDLNGEKAAGTAQKSRARRATLHRSLFSRCERRRHSDLGFVLRDADG